MVGRRLVCGIHGVIVIDRRCGRCDSDHLARCSDVWCVTCLVIMEMRKVGEGT